MFKLFQTFLIAYETRNFSKAADYLFMSQPAVSNQIKQLEEELECKLFKRQGKQEMVPTKSADTLYKRLLNLKDDWQETIRLVKKTNQEKTKCRISASHTFSIYYLPELMRELIPKFPEIMFELEMKNSEEVLESMSKHKIDFGFIEMPLMTDDITRIEVMRDELVLVSQSKNELWLSREETSGVHHYMQKYLLSKNLNPQKIYVKNNEIIIKMLEEGIGSSIISKRAVTPQLKGVHIGDDYIRPLYFLKRKHMPQNDLIEVANEIEVFYQRKIGNK